MFVFCFPVGCIHSVGSFEAAAPSYDEYTLFFSAYLHPALFHLFSDLWANKHTHIYLLFFAVQVTLCWSSFCVRTQLPIQILKGFRQLFYFSHSLSLPLDLFLSTFDGCLLASFSHSFSALCSSGPLCSDQFRLHLPVFFALVVTHISFFRSYYGQSEMSTP